MSLQHVLANRGATLLFVAFAVSKTAACDDAVCPSGTQEVAGRCKPVPVDAEARSPGHDPETNVETTAGDRGSAERSAGGTSDRGDGGTPGARSSAGHAAEPVAASDGGQMSGSAGVESRSLGTLAGSPSSGPGASPPGAERCQHPDDVDCSPRCGDGVVTPPELCEPMSTLKPCATSCDDRDPCTLDAKTGTPEQCNVMCTHMPIVARKSGDGCCLPNSNANTDHDCKPVCGNGVRESEETCDGNCPHSCDDGNPCTQDMAIGAADSCNAACVYIELGRKDGDGCCPISESPGTDNDCAPPHCGNGQVESDEECDLGGVSTGSDRLPRGTEYDESSCDPERCVRRYAYTPCSTDADCGPGPVTKCGVTGHCLTVPCKGDDPFTPNNTDLNNYNCMLADGRRGHCLDTNVCVARCASDSDCPKGVVCGNYLGQTFCDVLGQRGSVRRPM